MDIKFIQQLETRLNQNLPGEDAQNLMAPIGSEQYRIASEDHSKACVLVLLFPKNNEWYICMIERTSIHPDDKHAGQISLPGGKLDKSDYSYEDCALRETYEEIGVPPESIGILGELTPLFVYVSNFMVYPFVGFTTEHPKFVKQETEVKEIIEVPLSHFLKSKNKSTADIVVRGMTLHDTPYYSMNGKHLWGATAMMMSELEQIVKEIIL